MAVIRMSASILGSKNLNGIADTQTRQSSEASWKKALADHKSEVASELLHIKERSSGMFLGPISIAQVWPHVSPQ